MKRVISVVAAAGAFTVLGAAVATAAVTAAPGNPTTHRNMVTVDKGRHDICIGTLGPNGDQRPLLCINLPQTGSSQ